VGRGKHRVFPNQDTEDKTKVLRAKVKSLEAEIKRLKSELHSLNKAFEKTGSYIKDNLDNFIVEKVIDGVKKEKTMVEIKADNKCPQCNKGELKSSKLPFGKMEICLAVCGYRRVVND
jgi:DNA repair exonuclease SbcCD ATPase subunit